MNGLNTLVLLPGFRLSKDQEKDMNTQTITWTALPNGIVSLPDQSALALSVFVGRWHSNELLLLLVAFSVGFIAGHLFWGTEYKPGQKGGEVEDGQPE